MKVLLLDRNELYRANLDVTEPLEIESLDGDYRFLFTWPILSTDLLRYSWDKYAGQSWGDAVTAIETDYPEALNIDLARNSRISPTYIKEGDKVAVQELSGDWQLYEVAAAETELKGSARVVRVECEHVYYDLAQEELVNISTSSDDATFALTQVLSGTPWQVGTVEVTTSRTVTISDRNPLAALQQIVNNWGGELRFRVTVSGSGISGRYVDLLSRRGEYTGKRFEFGHDLQNIRINIDRSLVKTAMYGWGQGESIADTDETDRLDFANIEWVKGEEAELHPGGLKSLAPVDKPIGQTWVGDDTARFSYGRVDPLSGGYRHIYGEYESQAKSPQALLWETWRQLQNTNQPRLNVEATVAALEQITGREHEGIALGDTCLVKVENIDPLEARIIRVERNRLNPGNTVVELGNFRSVYSDDFASFQSRLNSLDGRAGIWDRAEIIDPDRTVPTSVLSGVIDVVSNQIKTGGGHVTIDGDGFWITDTDDPATAISAVRGVSHAGEAALVLGTRATILDAWDFRVGFTSDGFRVFGEEIIAGKILTDLVRIEGDTSFYWNGQNLYAIDPGDTNRQIRFGKYDGTNYGLAFTTDGGTTWQAALTHDGLVVGSHTQFESGYDPTMLEQFDNAAKDALAERFGYSDYAEMVTETAGIGSTLISGGYINTDLIEAGAISVGMLGADIIDAGRIRADLIHIGTDTSYDDLVKHTWLDYTGDTWQDAINSIQARLGGTLVPLHYDMARSGVASPRDLDIGVLNGLEGLNLGSMAYENAVERAKLGTTIIDGGYLKTGFVDASRIDVGTLNSARVSIGPDTLFAAGYDPSALDGLVDKDALAEYLGYIDYDDWKDTALLGNTIIDGGYINTSLLEAGSILAGYIGAGEIVVGHLGDTILSGGQIKTELVRIGAGTGYDAPQKFTWGEYAGQTWSQAIATIEARVGTTPVWVLDMCRTAFFNPRELDHATQEYFDALGNMAYEDAVQRAKLGETIIDGGYIVTGLIDASRIDTGVLNAARVRIGSQTTFDTGYSPVAVRNEILGSLGDMAYEDAVEKAKLGTTLIDGGYIVTGLIDASRIDVGTLNVNRISVLPDEKIGSAATWNSHDNTITTIENGIITTGTLQVRQGAGSIAAGITGALSGDNRIRIWAGQTFANRTSAPFRVDQAGNLVAESGAIGGWTIDSVNGLKLGATINTRGISTGATAFYAGHATPASAPFRVTTAGVLTAENVEGMTGLFTVLGCGVFYNNSVIDPPQNAVRIDYDAWDETPRIELWKNEECRIRITGDTTEFFDENGNESGEIFATREGTIWNTRNVLNIHSPEGIILDSYTGNATLELIDYDNLMYPLARLRTEQMGNTAGVSVSQAVRIWGMKPIGEDYAVRIRSVDGQMHFVNEGAGANFGFHFNGGMMFYRDHVVTTGVVANTFINSANGVICRFTSAKKYKTDIEPLELKYAERFLEECEPVFYRSACDFDNKDWSHYGYVADDVMKVEPRLVEFNDKGEPEGFMYARVGALLHVIVKEHERKIKLLEEKFNGATRH